MDKQTQTELEAAAFRGLLEHLRQRTDVQNIDLMILAGFCRNCLAKWYKKAASEKDIEMDYPTAQEYIYAMPYSQWKQDHQQKASQQQIDALDKADKAVI